MTVYEQNRPLDFSKAKFDNEYALRFATIANHREIFTAWNVPVASLSLLIERAKELIPNEFIVEYHSPYTKNPLFVGPKGLMLSAFRFNTLYNTDVQDDETHVVKVDDKTYKLVKKFVASTAKQNRFLIQNCLIREFVPNQWVTEDSDKIWSKNFTTFENNLRIEAKLAQEVTDDIRHKIIKTLQGEFEDISYNNGIFRFDNHYLTNDFYEYWIDREFEFADKTYNNWFYAFLDACSEAEKYLTDIRLPIDSNENSIFKDHDKWKPFRACFQELLDVIEESKMLERKISALKIELMNSSNQDLSKLKYELDELQSEATVVRRKRVELNIRNTRQVNILLKKYMRPYLIKTDAEKTPEIEELSFKFSYLEQLRKDFLKQIKRKIKDIELSYNHHEAHVVALNNNGDVVQKGNFSFNTNPQFINILFSQNISLFEGVTELMFTLKDGKTVFHYPSYAEQGVARSKLKAIAVKFDPNINLWISTFNQDPQDLVVQACLNQGEKVIERILSNSKEA